MVTINDCVSSYAEPAAPWGGLRRSGSGRTHGLLGLREMVSARYVSTEFGGGAHLWWYPYGEDFRRLMAAAEPALHARGLLPRLRGIAALLRSPRFWRRARIPAIVRNLDRLFH